MDQNEVGLVCERFALGEPGPCSAIGTETSGADAWRLTTGWGRWFVKRVDISPDPSLFASGQRLELQAYRAGITMPRPVPTRDGEAAAITDDVALTVHEWIDGRPSAHSDDLSSWLGGTLARMAMLQPTDQIDSWCYRLPERATWQSLAARGVAAGEPWGEQLICLLDVVVDVQSEITEFVHTSDRRAAMHPDVEPHNVLIGAAGPVLVDWDYGAPDSVPHVLAHAALVFGSRNGRPDADRIRATVRTYREAGGTPLGPVRGLLSRRLAMMLSRLAERVSICLGDARGVDVPTARTTAVARLTQLPTFVESLREWESLFAI